MIVTPFSHDRLARLGELAVAALLGREVDDDRARPIRFTISAVTRIGARLPGMSAVVMHDVGLRRRAARAPRPPASSCTPRTPPSRSRRRLASSSTLDLDELRAEALDLLLDDLADVERLDHRAEARAVAIAWSPATPAPRTSTRAGAIVPAAVISIGKSFGSASAARTTAQ